MKKTLKKNILLCIIFAISMAYLESAIVVYLRELYFPSGFQFGAFDIPLSIRFIEIGREAVTIIMLLVISKMVANNWREWFAYFSLSFGVWDIWYYLWLKIFIDWPGSLLEWDILFLIPFSWTSPVLAPVLVSFFLIVSSIIIFTLEEKNRPLHLSVIEWILEVTAGVIIIISFLMYPDIIKSNQIPDYYPWWLFCAGMILGLAVFGKNVKQSLNK